MDGSEKMSTQNPGNCYDAISSWNGYEHQGLVAIWYAISKINQLLKAETDSTRWKTLLQDYFLEVEWLEDFSVLKRNGATIEYESTHQVKKYKNASILTYQSALLGLVKHVREVSSISQAYLHVSVPLNLKGKTLLEHLCDMVGNPAHILEMEQEICTKRGDLAFQEKLIHPGRGGTTFLRKRVLDALERVALQSGELSNMNLQAAFDVLLKELAAEKAALKSVSEVQLKKISIFAYPISGMQDFCGVGEVKNLLKETLKQFFTLLAPSSYKATDADFHEKSYLYLLGKLNQHIVARDLYGKAYKVGERDRKICFLELFNWLSSDEIERNGTDFYLYHVKEGMFQITEDYCKHCSEPPESCVTCNVLLCKEKLGALSFPSLQSFLYKTNPQVSGDMSMSTYPKFLSEDGIVNPFLEGIQQISQPFIEETQAITYCDRQKLHYVLTTLHLIPRVRNEQTICEDILRNQNIYQLLMDCDCLISRDISCNSIYQRAGLATLDQDPQAAKHIAHCKDVKIVPLKDSKTDLCIEEETVCI